MLDQLYVRIVSHGNYREGKSQKGNDYIMGEAYVYESDPNCPYPQKISYYCDSKDNILKSGEWAVPVSYAVRHNGHEIVLIVQDHRFLDVDIRRLCARHIHYKRLLGSSKLARYELAECFDYEKSASLKMADRTFIKLDKKYFGLYQSSKAEHHFKINIPRRFYFFLFLIVAAIYFFYSVFGKVSANNDTSEPLAENTLNKSVLGSVIDNVTGGNVTNNTNQEARPLTVEEYIDLYKPRIEGLPHTAPAYDKLTEPQTYPKLSCLITKSKAFIKHNKNKISLGTFEGEFVGCSCYTQQATLYQTPFNVCVNIVENGYFDPARSDRTMLNSQSQETSNQGLYSQLANK